MVVLKSGPVVLTLLLAAPLTTPCDREQIDDLGADLDGPPWAA